MQEDAFADGAAHVTPLQFGSHLGVAASQGRFYAGRPILAQFCPVTDFKDARCRQFEEATCSRGGYCNFMHLKKVSSKLQRKLLGALRERSRRQAPANLAQLRACVGASILCRTHREQGRVLAQHAAGDARPNLRCANLRDVSVICL